ncbi:uncharacterized Golgi apparatus membrane CG5021 isoform X1 [Olea europaea subsp. europaea]|uniref:Golgi apparatus membrane protein TVP23 n=1 Tax=Olea europaea subsp. europaea TaxID=158383 RepID=A0A8S0VNP0_OLEEU|nr:uncharacterized Golgi apparatus membrane CG5021 isoform X1 [Olea europaea subsp. europaea]
MGQSASQANSNNELFFGGDTNARGANQGTKRFRHPMAALFHVLFKSLALIFYLFGGLFGQDFISTFVAVILLISMDFWVVKNVTGRLLAGLRWSNYIDDEGNSHWIFENKNSDQGQLEREGPFGSDTNENQLDSSADSSIFWTGLIMAPTMWLLLMFAALFKLNVQWFMLVILAAVLSLSNLYGYIRCRLGTSDIKSSVTQFVAKQVFLNFLTGGSSSK